MEKGIDYIGVTVCFYCHDGKGNLLLQKRNKNARDEHNTWDCGGGSVQFGETFEEAVKRELKEEYGCKPIELHFAGVNNVLRKHKGSKTHWICIIYVVKVDPKKVAIGEPEKIDEIRWFPKNRLPSPLHSMYLTHLRIAEKFIV